MILSCIGIDVWSNKVIGTCLYLVGNMIEACVQCLGIAQFNLFSVPRNHVNCAA